MLPNCTTLSTVRPCDAAHRRWGAVANTSLPGGTERVLGMEQEPSGPLVPGPSRPPKEFRHPEFSEAFAKLDAENNNAPRSGSGVKVHVDLSDAKEKAEALESREVFDPVVYHNSDVFTPHIVALEGDRSFIVSARWRTGGSSW